MRFCGFGMFRITVQPNNLTTLLHCKSNEKRRNRAQGNRM